MSRQAGMFLGVDAARNRIELDAADLTTHAVILGRSGSGKTGLTIALLEEVAKSGASALVLDPKGDLTNLALPLTTQEEFAAWVEAGVDPRQTFMRQRAGLAMSGLSYDDVMAYKRAVDVTIYAPGKTEGGGRAVNVFPTFQPPRSGDLATLRARASRDVDTVISAVGQGKDKYNPAIVFLSEAVVQSWRSRRPLPVENWPTLLTQPPSTLATFGGMQLEDFFPKRQRNALARALVGFRHQADRWLHGENLDLHRLASGRPQLAVMTMRHLSEDDRLFFTSAVMNRVVDFMFETASSLRLKLIVALDEARGYLPPHPYNPPTKGPIGTILAQGRAQGIGMVIGTQNPMDLDYKALSNVGTWLVGRLRSRDMARDLEQELRARGVDLATVENMAQRQFLLLDKRGGHHDLRVRHTLNYLRGPLGIQELAKLTQPEAEELVFGLFRRLKRPEGYRRRLFGFLN